MTPSPAIWAQIGFGPLTPGMRPVLLHRPLRSAGHGFPLTKPMDTTQDIRPPERAPESMATRSRAQKPNDDPRPARDNYEPTDNFQQDESPLAPCPEMRLLPISSNLLESLPISSNPLESLPISSNPLESLPISSNLFESLPTTLFSEPLIDPPPSKMHKTSSKTVAAHAIHSPSHHRKAQPSTPDRHAPQS